jgi:hypothetical protein
LRTFFNFNQLKLRFSQYQCFRFWDLSWLLCQIFFAFRAPLFLVRLFKSHGSSVDFLAPIIVNSLNFWIFLFLHR